MPSRFAPPRPCPHRSAVWLSDSHAPRHRPARTDFAAIIHAQRSPLFFDPHCVLPCPTPSLEPSPNPGLPLPSFGTACSEGEKALPAGRPGRTDRHRVGRNQDAARGGWSRRMRRVQPRSRSASWRRRSRSPNPGSTACLHHAGRGAGVGRVTQTRCRTSLNALCEKRTAAPARWRIAPRQ